MTSRELPGWAVRLREERLRRLWSQKGVAVRLRDAADEETRAGLPGVGSIQRYVRGYEAGEHLPGDLYAELYCRVFGLSRAALFGGALARAPGERAPTVDDARSLAAWIASTNVSDDGVDALARTVSGLAEAHADRPPGRLLAEVSSAHRQVQDLLRTGRQRQRQARELFRLDADLLAHAALLLGDLHHYQAAAAHGSTAQLCAQEAEASPAIALSVQAKTARWRMQFAASADLARQGYDRSPATSLRVLLASQEAHAAALTGNLPRARAALARAESAAGGPICTDSGVSAWSCPRPRQALFALAVAIRAQDADEALRAAAMADVAWAGGTERVTGTWAQVRLGAAIAWIMKSDLGGACAEIDPVMDIAPQYRMATITGYTRQIRKRLQQRRFLRDATAMQIRARLEDFESAALDGTAREPR